MVYNPTPGYSTSDYAAEAAATLDGMAGVNASSSGNIVTFVWSVDTSEFNCGEVITITQSMSFETTIVNCDPVIVNNPYWSCEPIYNEYSFGVNGKENDNEVKGDGNQQDYGLRIYDNRLGRFLSVDPLFKGYPFYTPYQFAANCPIKFIDLDGAEAYGPPFPAAGTPHLRYTYLPVPNPNGGDPTHYYRTAEARDVTPPALARVNKQNALNNGQGVTVLAHHVETQGAPLWEYADGPAPTTTTINTNINTHTATFDGSEGNSSGTTTNLAVTIPTGDAVTSATFTYNNGGGLANSFIITDATTGAVLATTPVTAGNGSIAVPVTPSQSINIQQVPGPEVAGNTNDSWDYSLNVVVTTTTVTPIVQTSSQPVVSSPSAPPPTPLAPAPPVIKPPSPSTSTTTNSTTGR